MIHPDWSHGWTIGERWRAGAIAAGAAMASAAAVVAASGLLPATAGVMGAVKAVPYPQAVQHSRSAAKAVLAGAGSASCLRGKLTNSLLGLSSSCEAAGEHNPLCQLADAVVLKTGDWDRSFLDSTARQLLQLSEPAPDAPR